MKMKKILLAFVASIALAIVTTACEKQKSGTDKSNPELATAGAKSGEDRGVVVATVNDTAIYQKDFDKALERVKSAVGNRELTDEDKKAALNELVDYELFFQEGMKQGLFNDDFIKRRVITNVMQKDVWDKANAMTYTDEEIKAYYDAHQEEFKEPVRVHASHILIKLAPNATDAQKKAARAKADEVFARVKKTPAKWLEISKQYSDVPTRDQGGDLGFFSRDRTPKPFGDAAFGCQRRRHCGPHRNQLRLPHHPGRREKGRRGDGFQQGQSQGAHETDHGQARADERSIRAKTARQRQGGHQNI